MHAPTALASAAALAVCLHAQERTPVESAERTAVQTVSPRSTTAPEASWVLDGYWINPTDDRPNFAPMRATNAEAVDDTDSVLRVDGNPYILTFTNGSFTPPRGIDPTLAKLAKSRPTGSTYGFVMIRGRITVAKVTQLRALGLTLLGAHTFQSLKAKIPLASVERVAALPFVHWIGHARPEQKLDVQLATTLAKAEDGDAFDVHVTFFSSDVGSATKIITVGKNRFLDGRNGEGALRLLIPNGPFQRSLEKLGFDFEFYDDSIYCMRGHATRAEILKIRDLDFVIYVELHQVHRLFHDQALGMVSQDRVRTLYPGTLAPVAIIDTGIASQPWHNDVVQKRFWGFDNTGHGALQDGHSHGTHVAGTVFGEGVADVRYKGCAPACGRGGTADYIFIGRYFDSNGSAKGNVASIYDAFKVSQTISSVVNPKRSVINNSWGASSSNGYYGSESSSRTIDNVVHDYQQCYVFASGNTNSVPGTWGGSPGVAKNVLAVGALTDRFTSSSRPGDAAYFTRYATRDGRRKPEVSGPGYIHTSCKANTTTSYSNKSGTSMAAPTISGCLASLVGRSSFFKYNPSAAKALAVASAKAGTSINFNTQIGFGLINSYKMNFNDANSSSKTFSGALVYPTTNAVSFNHAISASTHTLKVVLVWTESAASSGATQALKNSLRLYMDIPPYTTAASGEHSIASTVNNVVFSTTLASALKGKTVRFTVHADTLLPSNTVNWSVCVFEYFKDPVASTPVLTQTADREAIPPGGSVVLTAAVTAQSTQDEFNSARVYYDSPSSFTVSRIDRTTADNLLQTYTNSSHVSYPYPRVTNGTSGGMVVGQGISRPILFTMTAPTTEGIYQLFTRVQHHGSSSSTVQSNGTTVCVDGQNPNGIGGLTSSSLTAGTWSNNASLLLGWTQASDQGCAGIDKILHLSSEGSSSNPTTSSPSLGATAVSYSTTLTESSTGHYFNVRAIDKAGNLGSTSSIGPFKIDTTKPLISSVSINGGATHTASLTVQVTASGADGGSGVDTMQYSSDGSTWSTALPYQTTARSVDLSSNGGNGNEGTKTLLVRLRDKAGNVSSPASAQITYERTPNLVAAPVGTLKAVNRSAYRLTGTDILGIQSVRFGTKTITQVWTNVHDNYWANGSFRIVSDSEVLIYPPQALTPATYAITVSNKSSTSNSLNVSVTKNTTSIIRTSAVMTVPGSVQTFAVARGNLPTRLSRAIIAVSLSNKSSVAPGFYNLAIGNNFTNLWPFPQIGFDANGVAAQKLNTVAAMKGLTIYMQAGLLDLTPSATWPLPVSDSFSTTYR